MKAKTFSTFQLHFTPQLGWGSFLTAFVLLLCLPRAPGESYLFTAESRGGIMSLDVDTHRTGLTLELSNNSLGNLGHHIAEMSYDPYSRYVLAREFKPDRVTYAPVCSDPSSPAAKIFNESSEFPIVDPQYQGSTLDCPKCKAGPFALFDNRIYFLVTGDFGLKPLTRFVAQLRVLQNCDDCRLNLEDIESSFKVFKTPYLFNCSRVVAEVFSQSMIPHGFVHLKAGRSIKIIKSEQGLHFFFQLFVGQKQKRSFADLILYQTTDAGDVTVMRTEKVDGAYAQWNINALGSVDYKDGLLCWTGADRLYCGLLSSPIWSLHSVHRLLYPGEGAAKQICQGHPPDLLVYITGVAIAEAADIFNKRVIYFSCYPQWKGLGGTGMIKVSTDGREKHVFAITRQDGRTPIFSGTMFALDAPLGECQPPGRLQICLDPPVWVNKPGGVLRDHPDPATTPTNAPVAKTIAGSVAEKERGRGRGREIGEGEDEKEERELEDSKGQEEVEIKMQESKMSPDPQIIVVDNVKSIDEFDKERNGGNRIEFVYLKILVLVAVSIIVA